MTPRPVPGRATPRHRIGSVHAIPGHCIDPGPATHRRAVIAKRNESGNRHISGVTNLNKAENACLVEEKVSLGTPFLPSDMDVPPKSVTLAGHCEHYRHFGNWRVGGEASQARRAGLVCWPSGVGAMGAGIVMGAGFVMGAGIVMGVGLV
jgi:hypothetical protein